MIRRVLEVSGTVVGAFCLKNVDLGTGEIVGKVLALCVANPASIPGTTYVLSNSTGNP